MKISELIAELEELQKEHGDLEVRVVHVVKLGIGVADLVFVLL